jgi:beta-phosphoglucomutase-like phosphatase (HAD superfamily)
MIEAIIFDFDGVLIESEYVSNVQIAAALTTLGHPTTVEEALDNFVGLGGTDFHDAVSGWIGGPIPEAFHDARRIEDARVMREGLDAVAGAVDFVRSLPVTMPKAIASSSTTNWIKRHLDHIGLSEPFGMYIYSGREHVSRGKPAPDIYIHAAAEIGADIAKTLIIEDSPVGVTGAVASGAQVVGLAVGRHCADGHGEKLRGRGAHHVAHSFAEVAALLR